MDSARKVGNTMIRAGVFEGFRDLVGELGGDAHAILTAAGLQPDLLNQPDKFIGTRDYRVALNLAAMQTGQPQFGLLLSQRQSFDKLGAVGYLVRHAPTLQVSIERLIRHLKTHDTGSVTTLETSDDMAIWTHRLSGLADESAVQQTELAVGLACRFFRSVLGDQWSPERILFEHARPANVRVHDRIFRSRVDFDQTVTAIEFPAAELAMPLRTTDPGLFEILQKYVDGLETGVADEAPARVRVAILTGLEYGATDLASVAQAIGLSKSALQGQLRRAGTSFHALLDDVRYEQGRRYLRETRLPIAEIATLLGYAESAVFTRAFARRAAMPPRRWRQQHG